MTLNTFPVLVPTDDSCRLVDIWMVERDRKVITTDNDLAIQNARREPGWELEYKHLDNVPLAEFFVIFNWEEEPHEIGVMETSHTILQFRLDGREKLTFIQSESKSNLPLSSEKRQDKDINPNFQTPLGKPGMLFFLVCYLYYRLYIVIIAL